VSRSGRDVTCVRLPELFRRFPCPSSNSALEGTVEVDLGVWRIDGKNEQLHLRINVSDLPKLAKALSAKPGRALTLGYGALEPFFAAGGE
jgi:hypothetical protein